MSREEEIKLKTPGVRAVLRTSIRDEGGSITFDKNTPVLVEPLDWPHTARYRVTQYHDAKTIKDGKPESNGEIETGEQAIFSVDPKKTFRFVEHYRPINTTIFSNVNSPHVDEISQGIIGDCTLLAAMQSILSHPDGAAFIRTMMKENGDGTVTVRLYHPITGEPEYFRVNSAILYEGNRAVSKHKAPWVHVLEAAFAARGLKNEINLPISASAAVYSDGLTSSFVLKSLIGVNSQREQSPKYPTKKVLSDLKTYIQGMNDALKLQSLTQNELHEKIAESLFTDARIDIIKSIFPKNDPKEIREKIVSLYLSELLQNKEERDEYRKKYGVDETKRVLDFATASDNTHNKVFSRDYVQSELLLYETIEKRIKAGSVLIASSETEFNIDLLGVFEDHAYSVVGVRKKMVKKPNDESTELHFVELRNPWGKVGRKYMQHRITHDIKSDRTEDGLFSVELKDFCQHFKGVYLSDASSILAHAKKIDTLRREIKALMQQPINVDAYSLASLLALRDVISKLESAVDEFEFLQSDLPSFRHELDGYKTALQNRRDILNIYLYYEANQLNRFAKKEIKEQLNQANVSTANIVALQALVSETRVKQLFLQQFSQNYLTSCQTIIQNVGSELVEAEKWLHDTTSKNKTLFACCDMLNTAIQGAFDLQTKRQLSDGMYSVISSLLRQAKIGRVADKLGDEKNEEAKKVGSLFSKANALFQKLKTVAANCFHFFDRKKRRACRPDVTSASAFANKPIILKI